MSTLFILFRTALRDVLSHPAWGLALLAGLSLIFSGPVLDLPGLAFPAGDRHGQAGAMFMLELGLDAAQFTLAAAAAVGGALLSRRLDEGVLARQLSAPAPEAVFVMAHSLAVLAASLVAGLFALAAACLAAGLASPEPGRFWAGLLAGSASRYWGLLPLALFISPLMVAAGFSASPGGVARLAFLLFLADAALNLALTPDSPCRPLFRAFIPDFGVFSLSGLPYGRDYRPLGNLLYGLGGFSAWFGLALLALERYGRERL